MRFTGIPRQRSKSAFLGFLKDPVPKTLSFISMLELGALYTVLAVIIVLFGLESKILSLFLPQLERKEDTIFSNLLQFLWV